VVRIPGGVVEIAFDQGHLIAGKSRQPVLEVEFELLRGPVAGLIALASRWVNRHGLWLDTRSKAERGDLLARGLNATPPTRAVALELDHRSRPDAAARSLVGNCLAQILPNASAVAAAVHDDEHLHQLRVGVRRLRTALGMIDGWTAAPTDEWQAALSLLFGRLGAARDQAVLDAELVPALNAAGAPWAEFAPAADAVDDPLAVLREPTTTALWLALQGFVSGEPSPSDGVLDPADPAIDGLPLRDRMSAWLEALFHPIRSDAGRFGSLDDESRHRLRRRVKRLRYGIEFSAALFDAKPVRRFMRPLAAAQDDLGRFNDLVVGLGRMRLQAQTEARAWFGVGWLSARREAAIAECSLSLQKLRSAEPFWRKGRARRR
jgi:CHAD domain-containing protein